MQAFLDLSDEGHDDPSRHKGAGNPLLNGRELYAVTTILDGAPFYALVHEDSDALISVEEER